jgi:small subunit ribosomal protein S2
LLKKTIYVAMLQKNELQENKVPVKIKLEDMIQSGMHFGHSTREWNPRMGPYIYGERNGRHILDLVQTYFLVNKVLSFIEEQAAQGKTFLFVGTKQQAAPLIAKTALACESYYVNQRWLGGMLTNWRTIQKSLRKLQDYRQAEERGDWNLLKKQEISRKRREKDRLEKYLSGVENMSRLPGVVIIIGQTEEIHAVKECRQLGIPTVTLLDSNCDPRLADWFLPANDDSVSALSLILSWFQEAVQTGQRRYRERQGAKQRKSTQIRKTLNVKTPGLRKANRRVSATAKKTNSSNNKV